MHRGKYQKKPIFPPYLGIVCLVLVAVVAMNSIIDAKYVTMKRDDPVAVAKAFYFESDMLKADTVPTYTLPAGTTEITFVLRNNVDALRYSDVNIGYSVTLSGASSDSKTGTLTRKSNEPTEQTITFKGLAAGTYTVKATATSPYSAVLQAKFVVAGAEKTIEYEVNDQSGSPIAQLTVRTNSYRGNVKISWPSDVYPDQTDPLVSGSGSLTVKFTDNAEYTFVFFKSNHGSVYTKDNITATATS